MPVSRHRRLHKDKPPARLASGKRRPLPPIIALPDFLRTEGKNLEAGLSQHQDLLTRFEVLNSLFHQARPHIQLERTVLGTILGALFDMTQFHLHFTMATFLRGHPDEAFASARKAFDATMNAMVLHAEPDRFEQYRRGAYPFSRITRYIGGKDRARTYPLGAGLVSLHGTLSEHASHADFGSLAPRIEHVRGATGVIEQQLFAWFSPHQADPPMDHAFAVDILACFSAMLRAWDPWIRARARGLPLGWRAQADRFDDWANGEQRRLHDEFAREGRPIRKVENESSVL